MFLSLQNKTLQGLVIYHIETLYWYRDSPDKEQIISSVNTFVQRAISVNPWYFLIPMRMLIVLLALLCLGFTRKTLEILPSEKRKTCIKTFQWIPAYGLLNKLVRSMTLLALYKNHA